MNRLLDRQVSVLGTEFAMNNTAKLCHSSIAHYFPTLSDKIGERCLERYNISIEYGETPSGKKTYNDAKSIIEEMNVEVNRFANMFMGVCKVAFENDDLQVYADLLDLLREYNAIVEQTELLSAKMNLYNGNLASYDAQIERFWIL